MRPSLIGMFKQYFAGAYAFDVFDDDAVIQSVAGMMIEYHDFLVLEISRIRLAYDPYTIDSREIYEDEEVVVLVIEIAFDPFYPFDETEYLARRVRYEVADILFLLFQQSPQAEHRAYAISVRAHMPKKRYLLSVFYHVFCCERIFIHPCYFASKACIFWIPSPVRRNVLLPIVISWSPLFVCTSMMSSLIF